MILLTGATGLVGSTLLRRLTARGEALRCLVRDPRRLGSARVQVQIALGDLADPPSFRNALRGVRTVIHLAASMRDQAGGSIEELNGIATWRMVQAAERAGVERFVFFSAVGASPLSPSRFLRAKALAEAAVAEAAVPTTVLAPSLVYAPGDELLGLLERMALLPVVPLPAAHGGSFQPIWAHDVADCVLAVLDGEPGGAAGAHERFELAGPDTLDLDAMVRLLLGALGRRRLRAHVPRALVRRVLQGWELAFGPAAFSTWDEAQLLELARVTPAGTADAERLGVHPRPMTAVLGAGARLTPA